MNSGVSVDVYSCNRCNSKFITIVGVKPKVCCMCMSFDWEWSHEAILENGYMKPDKISSDSPLENTKKEILTQEGSAVKCNSNILSGNIMSGEPHQERGVGV